ncbi:hypothetical protein IP90_02978 [Luteimonas cucumeris]|uniref:Uncharacterized protein n=1 Tax=Luteimonas cucumeris TaxID=985012 RepID=A0A562KX38_9GAMM|nr:hypothetical protein IP90_02978 [Luteimonas cucumeris]
MRRNFQEREQSRWIPASFILSLSKDAGMTAQESRQRSLFRSLCDKSFRPLRVRVTFFC